MHFIRHAALHNLTVEEFGIMLERHAQIVFSRDLALGGHCSENSTEGNSRS
jgi:hypothetical protein